MSGYGGVTFRRLDLQRLAGFAEQLHRRLPTRVVVGLRGTLGAGKTRLAQAIAQAAGIAATDVTSPTFTIVQHYRGSRLIHHIDAYRLADEDEFIQLGGEELFEDEALVLIEWPERITDCLPAGALMLDIEIDDELGQQENSQQENFSGAAADVHAEHHADRATRTIRASSGDQDLMAIMRQIQQTLQQRDGGADR